MLDNYTDDTLLVGSGDQKIGGVLVALIRHPGDRELDSDKNSIYVSMYLWIYVLIIQLFI